MIKETNYYNKVFTFSDPGVEKVKRSKKKKKKKGKERKEKKRRNPTPTRKNNGSNFEFGAAIMDHFGNARI